MEGLQAKSGKRWNGKMRGVRELVGQGVLGETGEQGRGWV